MRNYEETQSHIKNPKNELDFMNFFDVQKQRELELSKKFLNVSRNISEINSENEISNIINNISIKMLQIMKTQKNIIAFEKKVFKNDNQQVFTEILSFDEEKNIKYIRTNDYKYLDQYYKLRNDVYQEDNNWTKSTWFENEHDRKGHIFLALKDDEVVGGLRIMTSVDNEYLSDENPGTKYTYRNLLKFLDLDATKHYMEVDGFVVKKEYRDRYVAAEVVKHTLKYSVDKGCLYLIAIAALSTCRNDRILLKRLGYKDIKIVDSFQWTELECYNNSKDFPIVCVLKKDS